MEFSVLGPLEVRDDGRALELGGAKPRGLLALLLLHPREPVSAGRIALALWGEEAPATAVKTVQVHVSRLRRALGPDAVVTTSAGYAIAADAGELDADRFAQLVTDGRHALDAGDPGTASSMLRDALALWRGPPLGDLGSLPFAAAEVARLEEHRLEAVELRVEADLAGGRHAELVAELSGLVQEHPWRERLHAQLMLALYRSGRQADALDAYRRARRVLVDELGIEPGPELAALHQEILAQDPGLAGPVIADGALPAPPNRTVGREAELGAIAERLRAARLLTLIGPGGVGKTRLAIEAARAAAPAFADGVHFVALAPLVAAEEVPMAIVHALGIVVSDEPPQEAIARFLASRSVLLVADNCEHVLGVAPLVSRLLDECPRLRVLATSREPLSLRAEERRPVPPLGAADAAALFAERARAHAADTVFDEDDAAAVAEICRRLDGLPLAIELAAARSALLAPAEIARRLDAALGSGPRDAPERHRTLRATIDWSHELLSEEEKAAFARFAVFSGGATVAAAEAVTGAELDTLDRLVAKSLLVRQRVGGATRLTMLETVRAYALERFAADPDAPAIRARHFEHYRAIAERHGSERAVKGASRNEHLRVLDADLENVHAALARALEDRRGDDALALCVAVGQYWLMRDHYERAAESIERTLRLAGPDADPRLCVIALCARYLALGALGRAEERAAALADAEAIARTLGDSATLAHMLVFRSGRESALEQLDAATATADEAMRLAGIVGDDWVLAAAANAKAQAVTTSQGLSEAVEDAARLLERAGNVFDLVDVLGSSAYAAACLGLDAEASELVARAIPVARELDNRYVWMYVRGNHGVIAMVEGDVGTADAAFREELRLGRELAVVAFATEGLGGLAAVASARGDTERAARLSGAAEAYRYGRPSYPVEDRLRAMFVDPARSRLGEASWDAAAREGAAMGLDEAIAYALAG
jgi:predicted ATPase/DNA-binding SARP family transcriptional activator